MGKELIIDGEARQVPEDMTIAELKEEAEFPINDIVRWRKGDEDESVSDKETVEQIPDGANVFSQPPKTEMFG